MATRNEEPGTPTALLVASAWWSRWRAPELAAALARHAASQAEDVATRAGVRAVAADAAFRLGDPWMALPDAVAALNEVEAVGPIRFGAVAGSEIACSLRVDIAGCGASVGLARAGFAVLRPVFAAEPSTVPHATRASALVRCVRGLAAYGNRQELDAALQAADHLYTAETRVHKDTVTALRALLRAVVASRKRRLGDASAAVDAAADGLRLVPAGHGSASDAQHARVRLTQELVGALLDRGEGDAAERFAQPVLAAPIRAQDAAASGWLRVVLADRLYRERGELARSQQLLHEASAVARRHQLSGLLAAASDSLAQVCELTGDHEDALACLRGAHAARRRRERLRERVRSLLDAQFPASGSVADLFAVLRQWSGGQAEPGRATGPVPRRQPHGAGEPAPRRHARAAPAGGAPPGSEPADPAPASTVPARRRRGTESSRYLAVSALPGLVVAEGSGGRRRAPEPEREDDPSRAGASPARGASEMEPSAAPVRSAPEGSGRHGARDIGARVAAPRQRVSGRYVPRQARHAASEEPRRAVSGAAGAPPEATAVAQAPEAETAGEETTGEETAGVDVSSNEPAPTASPPAAGRADLGLADLLAQALAAYRDGDRQGRAEGM